MSTDISTVLKKKFNKNAEFLLTDAVEPDIRKDILDAFLDAMSEHAYSGNSKKICVKTFEIDGLFNIEVSSDGPPLSGALIDNVFKSAEQGFGTPIFNVKMMVLNLGGDLIFCSPPKGYKVSMRLILPVLTSKAG